IHKRRRNLRMVQKKKLMRKQLHSHEGCEGLGIANADSAKMAWNLLYSEYHGGEHVRSVKLQNLRREFEYTRMRDSETLSEYLTRLTELINQMKTFGEVLSNERQVQKVLISLSKKYDPICIVIENTKTLETVDLQEVIAILKSQEQRLEMHSVDTAEKAFASFTVNQRKSWNSKGKSWEAKDKSQQNNYSAQNHTSTQFSNQENTKPQCKVTGNLFYANCSTTEIKTNEWYIDSGCSNHMTGNLELLVDVRTNVAGRVQMPTGALVSVAGIGSLSIDTAKGRKYIREVMYLPGLKENLLSVGQMDEHGYCLVFGEGCAGVPIWKTAQKCFPKDQAQRASKVLELVHVDLCGPMRNESVARNRYFMLIIDDFTRMIWVYFLRNKSEAFYCFKKFKSMTELQTGHKVQCIRSDRGGEFLSTDFLEFCEANGIQRQLTMAYTPQQNGVVERKIELCPTKALNNITPFEAYSGRKPGIAHLKVFGSLCYVHVPTELRHKLEPKSTKGVKCLALDRQNGSVMTTYSIENQVDLDLKSDSSNENSTGTPQTLDMQESTSSTPGDISSEERRTQAYDHTPLKWRRLDDVLAQCNLCIMEPEKYADAAQDESWLKAMEDELQMIEKNETWELVDRPTEKPVIGVKWVYKTKLNLDGSVQKNKARLVAKGYAQKPGLDYNETYAPVARLDTIRTLIALAAKKGWKLFQLDVKSAFLNGVLQEEVYVNQPEGFVIKGKEDKVYRLHKALYGLKQAQGLDDIVYTGSSQALLAEFKEDMMAKYEMTDLGLLHHFLGMGVVQTESSIFLHQKKYASTLLSKFGLTECKSVTTPLVATEKLAKDDGSGAANEEQYRSIVGSLLYLTATRPDIMYASSLLARFMHCPTNRHYGTAKRVLRYIKGTLDYGLEYVKGKSSILIGYCDSDWGGSVGDCKSTSGYAFSFGMKQNCVALSTAEAEYISAAEATTQAIWLRFVLEDFGELQTEATPLHCDNISAIAITKNPVFHQKTKHIDRRYHFIKDALQEE
ncbi:hypothetical protein Prudu_011986, partial [Prunus dulcis]